MHGTEKLNSSSSATTGDMPDRDLSPAWQIGLLAFISLLTLLAYWPVMFNFFNGDDFVHLSWLSRAIHQPELVWRNFHTSWLDGTTTKFYRPLISVFMVSDYALWGVNGLGFRISNLLFHLASTVYIFLIGKELMAGDASVGQKRSSAALLKWPLAAAALFALYPLHPEAVSWITGRVDSVVTPFCLAAIYYYMGFSKTAGPTKLILALIACTLGLLSKEMAITLPAVFVLFELIYNVLPFDKTAPTTEESPSATSRIPGNFFRRLFGSLLKTMPFWILLAAYFGVRYLALGTLVGGYDNSLLFISNMSEFIRGWLHALLMLVVPLNKMLINSHDLLSKLWPSALITSAVLAVLNLLAETRNRKHFLFLSGWLLLCLLPVYKLFNISDDLQGSRLAYLATVPLCMLLSAAMMNCRKLETSRIWHYARSMSVLSLIGLAGIILFINNQPWKAAGEENNAIRAGLQKLYAKIPGDPEILFLGLPDQINGAYTCRNSLDGMTKFPQLSRDIRNCLMVNAFEPIFPFGYLKDSIAENQNKLSIYMWNSPKKELEKIDVSADPLLGKAMLFSGLSLRNALSVPEQRLKPELKWTEDNSLVVRSSGKHPQFLELNLGSMPCFNVDFVELNLEMLQDLKEAASASLLYSNELNPDFELRRRCASDLLPGQKMQHLIFAPRALPEWALGGKTHNFRLMLPKNSYFKIKSLSITPAAKLMPKINFANSGYFGSKGYLHLGPKQRQMQVSVDISQIAQASKFAVEISRTNLLFEEQNPQKRSSVEKSYTEFEGQKQIITLSYEDLKAAGIYELRVFPLSSDGTICGAASDHIVISVD
ncbi:MAG: hypothetical protein K2X27_03985 [Candidatus Obscuribacterales bacterium]|nr:hypothetical protein [Candidatus Obscuribacterales bacterium]